MPEPTPAEIVPIALVREGLPVAPAIGSKEAVAGDVIKRVDEGKWREGFKIAEKSSLDKKNTSERIEEIGANPDRDAATGKRIRTPEEQAVYDRAKIAETFAFKFLEVGYDSPKMTLGEKRRLETAVLASAKRNPDLFAQLDPLTPDQQNEWARRKLRDPRYASEVGQILVAIGDPENKLGNDVLLTNDKFEEQQLEKKNKQLEIDDVDRRLSPINSQLIDFARPTGGTPGKYAGELDVLRANLSTTKTELQAFNKRLQSATQKFELLIQERLATLNKGGGGATGRRDVVTIDADIGTATTEKNNLQDEVNTRQADIDRIDDLEKQEKGLETSKQNLEKERRDRQAEMNKIELELKRRERLFMDAKALRASREEDIAKGLENVFAGATDELLDKEMQEYLTATNAELEAKKLKATDNNEKAMYVALQKEMQVDAPRKRKKFLGLGGSGEEYWPLSKSKVNGYHEALITNGPMEPARRLLMSQVNQATNAHYTLDEANAILANKVFADKMLPIVAEQILGKKMSTGGISTEDIHIIVYSEWGKDAIKNAVEKNAKVRTAIETDMGPGALSSPEFHMKLAEQIKKHPWWLALILGIPLLVGGAAMGKSLENIGK